MTIRVTANNTLSCSCLSVSPSTNDNATNTVNYIRNRRRDSDTPTKESFPRLMITIKFTSTTASCFAGTLRSISVFRTKYYAQVPKLKYVLRFSKNHAYNLNT